MSDHNLAEAQPRFDDMTALQRRLHNAAIVLGAYGDEYGFEGLLREAIVAIAAHSPNPASGTSEQQAGEAVAWVVKTRAGYNDVGYDSLVLNKLEHGAKLFTHPQQPLTEIRRLAIIMQARSIREAIEMTEDAHGITKDTK